jgi:hypothetical protein
MMLVDEVGRRDGLRHEVRNVAQPHFESTNARPDSTAADRAALCETTCLP